MTDLRKLLLLFLLATTLISCSTAPDDYYEDDNLDSVRLYRPNDLTFEYVEGDSIRLNWKEISVNETGYIFEHKTMETEFVVLDTLLGDSVQTHTFSNDSLFFSEVRIQAFNDSTGKAGRYSNLVINLNPTSFDIVPIAINGDNEKEVKFSIIEPYDLGRTYQIKEQYNFYEPVEFTYSPKSGDFARKLTKTGRYTYSFKAINSRDTSTVLFDTTLVSGFKLETERSLENFEMNASALVKGTHSVLVSGLKEFTGYGYKIYNEDEGWTAFTANNAFTDYDNMFSYAPNKVLIRNSFSFLHTFDIQTHSLKKISANQNIAFQQIAQLDDGRIIISGLNPDTDEGIIEIFDPQGNTIKNIDSPFDQYFSHVSQELKEPEHLFLLAEEGGLTAYYFDYSNEQFLSKETLDYKYYEIHGSELLQGGKVMFFGENGRNGVGIYEPFTHELLYTLPTNGTYIFSISKLNENIISVTGNGRQAEFVELYSEDSNEWIIIDEILSKEAYEVSFLPFPKGLIFKKLSETNYLLSVQGKSIEWKFN